MSHDRDMGSRNSERGSAMLVTLIVIAALLAGAAVLVGVQLASNNAADSTRKSTTALHCAEAGLAAARPLVVLATNVPLWGAAIAAPTVQPTWLNASAIDHNIDDDSNVDDFRITLEDNDDEAPPTNDRAVDNDLRIFIVSTCIDPRYAETPKQVRELIQYSGGGKCYNSQKGGCGKNGNGGSL